MESRVSNRAVVGGVWLFWQKKNIKLNPFLQFFFAMEVFLLFFLSFSSKIFLVHFWGQPQVFVGLMRLLKYLSVSIHSFIHRPWLRLTLCENLLTLDLYKRLHSLYCVIHFKLAFVYNGLKYRESVGFMT